ncbi:MAG: homoserine O-acetyltransferase [Candidatus Tectomicrobia bacterium]|uniref:Homoserine O-acetyltransferase n=1 Tax=Tectimicrobiota bacterium TaxID=2528274 RepID=A0A933LRF9_UNCTE|nr:homoserine O-acetyltransferase [Candidatus Tectomicrobia bacterium]
MKSNSVGIVKTELLHVPGPFMFDNGETISELDIAYEKYGRLSPERDNVILIAHALSGDAHVAGFHSSIEKKPGWWDNMIGPGKSFDTNRYFVICANVLGGCRGSTGPASINPLTGMPYALDFPLVTIKDMVNAQKILLDHLRVNKLLSVVGGSMGGMQVLQWAISYPEMVSSIIPIASALRHSAQQIAFNEVGRRAIMADPNWKGGHYYTDNPPNDGLAVARMIGHITYLSEDLMQIKFGRQDRGNREKLFKPSFEVEHYLDYQGESFVQRFDANSYLYITNALDDFNLNVELARTPRLELFNKIRCLVISFTSDWLYPSAQSKEIVRQLRGKGFEVTYCEVDSNHGHDAFLTDIETQTALITNFLAQCRQ